MKSEIEYEIPDVTFPQYSGTRVYMEPFTLGNPGSLSSQLSSYRDLVAELVQYEDPSLIGYLMIDESFIDIGKTQRRPGLHVDGNWIASFGSHDHQRPRHKHPPHDNYEKPAPGHNHPNAHMHHEYQRETIILASTTGACEAYLGNFDCPISDVGEVFASPSDLERMEHFKFVPLTAYAGNVTLLHGSTPEPESVHRQMIRISIPKY